MIAENSILCRDLDGVFSYNYRITGNGIFADHGVQKAIADDNARAGARLEVQEQAGLPQLPGSAVSASEQKITALMLHSWPSFIVPTLRIGDSHRLFVWLATINNFYIC